METLAHFGKGYWHPSSDVFLPENDHLKMYSTYLAMLFSRKKPFLEEK
jgi:hypothetical protein